MKKTLASLSCVLLSLFVSNAAFAEDKLIFAIDIIRHGDRTPAIEIPKSPYAWPEGLGQLTEQGMQQEYNLGVKMRAKYVDQYHLLPPHYHHDTMYVRSTNMDRTLMSAQSFLFGLYPLGVGASTMPSAFQPIPIHTIKKEEETLLIPDQDMKKFDFLLHHYVYVRPELRKKIPELRNQMRYWSEITGLKMQSYFDVIFLSDLLFVREQHNIPLPNGMTEETAAIIKQTGNWLFTEFFVPHEVGDATAGDLLREIKKYLQDATKENNTLKFVLYSAHDSTISMVMSALRTPLPERTPYASDFNLELFETPVHEYYLKASLNDQPIALPGCNAEICSLTQFIQFINTIPE